jgi:muramoyltetrapeptide carboxypeptidase
VTTPVQWTFDRMLQSLIHQPGFEGVQALLIGRFQVGSEMTQELLEVIVASKPEVADLPVVANLDIGHTVPILTVPIGGRFSVDVVAGEARVRVSRH